MAVTRLAASHADQSADGSGELALRSPRDAAPPPARLQEREIERKRKREIERKGKRERGE